MTTGGCKPAKRGYCIICDRNAKVADRGNVCGAEDGWRSSDQSICTSKKNLSSSQDLNLKEITKINFKGNSKIGT
jgi:hypothetical protein